MQQIGQEENKQEEEEYRINPIIIDTYFQNKIITLKEYSFILQNIDQQNCYIDKNYKLLYIDERDGFSQSYGTLQKNTNYHVNLTYYSEIPDGFYLKRILIDVKLCKLFQHENIIQIKDLQFPLYPQINSHMYHVSDLMDTNLKFVIKSQQNLTDEYFQFFMYQILRALYYIHSSKIIYCNLKPINVLINANCDLKLSNFGYCKPFKNTEIGLKDKYQCPYNAPEIIMEEQYSHKSDIWSAGCILAELLSRTILFPGRENDIIFKQQVQFCGTPTKEDSSFIKNNCFFSFIKYNPKYEKVSLSDKFTNANPLALDLLEKMLEFNPKKRPNALECLSHKYFAVLFDLEQETVCQEEFDESFFQNINESDEYNLNQLYKESLYFKSKKNTL